MNVSEFLVLTQVHTVPYFVLTKKHDILQKIAEACHQSIMGLCREHNNLAAILSSLMIQATTDTETLVMSLLNAVSAEFENVDCTELLRSEPQATAAELLKLGVDNDRDAMAKVWSFKSIGYVLTQSPGPSCASIPGKCNSWQAQLQSDFAPE